MNKRETLHANTPVVSSCQSSRSDNHCNATIKLPARRKTDQITSHTIKISRPSPMKKSDAKSALKISGQRLVAESLSLIRPMKCCNYDVPDLVSSTLPIEQVYSTKTANSFFRKNQPKATDTLSRYDISVVKRHLTALETKRAKMIAEAKAPQGSSDPEIQEKAQIYLSIVPTRFF